MNDAIQTLRLPYTYDLVTVPLAKRNARKQIGGMAVELVETMRNELMHVACVQYLRCRGLTSRQIDVIFRGDDGTREISIGDTIDRVEECSGEAEKTVEANTDADDNVSSIGRTDQLNAKFVEFTERDIAY